MFLVVPFNQKKKFIVITVDTLSQEGVVEFGFLGIFFFLDARCSDSDSREEGCYPEWMFAFKLKQQVVSRVAKFLSSKNILLTAGRRGCQGADGCGFFGCGRRSGCLRCACNKACLTLPLLISAADSFFFFLFFFLHLKTQSCTYITHIPFLYTYFQTFYLQARESEKRQTPNTTYASVIQSSNFFFF